MRKMDGKEAEAQGGESEIKRPIVWMEILDAREALKEQKAVNK